MTSISLLEVLIVSLISLLLGSGGSWVIIRYGHFIGLVDLPNERSSHQIPTPKGGGFGIVIAFLLFSRFYEITPMIWAPLTFISLLSLWGDRSEVPPRFRLSLQFTVSFIALVEIGIISFFGQWQDQNMVVFAVFFAVALIFFTGTANFYNFMDGINGIAGITGIVAFGLLSYTGYVLQVEDKYWILCLVLAFSCLGFLPFNIPKARVFMGDVGSILLGFAFPSLVLLMSQSHTTALCYAGFLLPFYFDATTTILERIKKKEKLSTAHRQHLYQVLANEKGIAHWKVSLGYGLFQLIAGISLINIRIFGFFAVAGLIFFYYVFFLFVSRKIKTTARKNQKESS